MRNTKQLYKHIFSVGKTAAGLFVLCVAMGLLSLLSTKGVVIGWGMSIVAPMIMGFYVGLFTYISRLNLDEKFEPKWGVKRIFKAFFTLVLFLILALMGFLVANELLRGSGLGKALELSLVGLYCSAIAVLLFVPVMSLGAVIGCFYGKCLKKKLEKNGGLSRAHHMALFLLLALPSAGDLFEDRFGFRDQLRVESVRSTFDIPANVQEIWNHLEFYEDAGDEATLLFALGFPKPLRTEGMIDKVGDISRCVYDKGYLVKEVTEVSHKEGRSVLGFDVIEQVNIEDKAIKLISGSFVLESQPGSNKTQLSLQSNYKPLMTPRWIWYPFERETARALHKHVADSIKGKLQRLTLSNKVDIKVNDL